MSGDGRPGDDFSWAKIRVACKSFIHLRVPQEYILPFPEEEEEVVRCVRVNIIIIPGPVVVSVVPRLFLIDDGWLMTCQCATQLDKLRGSPTAEEEEGSQRLP